ncbi:protein VACUOLELESS GAMETOPHYTES-like [Gastrolobium bilobum]|uniref:protein VACUOLELESS GAMETOPHYTES-like n=1 Tax=Gastrolobium bilobum TaxID=150636 RepID=UPI002AAF101B|nr:protein VACUOLELESS GAMETOPHYTES-like [Gastrolobium bilobum]
MMMKQKQVKKTRTLPLQNSPPPPSVEYQYPSPNSDQYYSTATTFVTKKSPTQVEFPTSPQLIFGEEIIHCSHPQHPLLMIDIKDLFTCTGCKEYGSGKRFVCQQCDFQLHDFCAMAPPALKAHPLHSQHPMLFHSKPGKSGMAKSKCDVCGKPTKGFAFLCIACAFQMHPCCAMLNTEIEYAPHPHTLRVMPTTPVTTTPSSGDSGGVVCGECKKRRSGKVYRCTVCDYHLHAVCAKSKINGLQANGIKPPQKPSMLAAAAKVASQVVIEFIGGIVEGIGESVGDVIVQNIVKGSSSATTGPR